MSTRENIVDCQIHIWEPNSAKRPWNETFATTRGSFIKYADAITAERALGAMDAVGVSRALLTSFHLYDDFSYVLEAARLYPQRFAVVPHIKLPLADPEPLIERLATLSSIVATRISLMGEADEHVQRLHSGDYTRLLDAVAQTKMPLMVLAAGHVKAVGWIAKRYPELQLIVDHLGMIQGPNREPPEDRFTGIEDLLALADIPNIAIKVSGVPTLSREAFPYKDVWPPLRRVIGAFGSDRMMWGSDFSRTRPLHNYSDALNYLKQSDLLSDSERADLLHRTADRLIRWPTLPR